MDATEQSTASNALPPLTKVAIAQLSPALEELEEKCISATVTLVWPYSSSTRSLSLLLSEPDFRLRRSNGQVKATFHGRVAEKVAESQVGIGDTVRLALKGSQFASNDVAKQTPGRCVAWDVHFENGVSVEINRPSKELSTVIIEQPVHAPHDTELPPLSTPRVIEIDPESDAVSGPGSWGSPAFLKSARSSYGGTLDTAFDPFAEDDGFVQGKGRKKPRYSLRREEWRILDEPDSPREREGTVDWDQAIEDELNTTHTTETAPEVQSETETQLHRVVPMENQAEIEDVSQGQLAIFVKPSLEQASSISGRRAPRPDDAPSSAEASSQYSFGVAFHRPTDTPQLRPIPSPGLPIPSPIISNHSNGQGYFSEYDTVSHTHGTHSIATGISTAESVAQGSLTEIPLASQLQATAASVEESEFSRSHERLHVTEGPLAEISGAASSDSMEFFDSPTFKGHPELDEHDIEMKDVNQTLAMGAVGDDAQYRADRNGSNREAGQEQEELEQEELEQEELEQEELEQEELEQDEEAEGEEDSTGFTPEAQHEYPASEAVTTKDLQIDHVSVLTSVDAVGVQPVEDEPKEYEYGEASQDEAANVPSTARDYPSLSPDYSGDGSHAAEDEALSDEEDVALYLSQDDEEGRENEREEDERDGEGFGLAQQPRPQTAQPEVIVLDSDSEDELASDQPIAPPSHPARRESTYEESFAQTAAADLASEDGEEDWSAADEEPDYDQVDGEGRPEDDERVHDSDLDDESSVDVLAREQHGEDGSIRGISVEQGQDDGSVAGDEADGHLSDEGTEDDAKSARAPESAIDLDSGEEEPQGDSRISGHDEDEHLRFATSALRNLDGVDDRDRHQGHVHTEEDQPESTGGEALHIRQLPEQPWKDVSTAQTPHPHISPSASIKPAHEQLLTPDPTQEAVSGRQAAPRRDEVVISSTHDMQAPSLGLNISYTTAPVTSIGFGTTPELPPEDLSTPQQPHVLGEADVAVPTAEPVHVYEQEKDDLLAVPAAPTVLIGKTPVPDRHAHGLRSKLSYFAPLATLVDHYNALVDTISIVHETTSIAKATSAPKDYFMTIQLTDPSLAGTTLQAQIFRRYRSAMPSLVEGNVILLRNFKVRSYDHSIMLVSVESSSWAVFDGSSPEAQINGPPVEYGSEERAYASGLRRWYREVGESMVADNKLQASVERDSMDRELTPSDVAFSESGSMDSVSRGESIQSARGFRRSRKSHRRVTIHELRDGTRYTEVGSPSSKESIHELRDGTVYANL